MSNKYILILESSLGKLSSDEQNAVIWYYDNTKYPDMKKLKKIIILFFRESNENFETFLKNYTTPKTRKTGRLDFILRYGNIAGERLYQEKVEKSKQTLDSFIARHGIELGPSKYKEYCISKSHSLAGYVFRHGEIDGTQKHKKYWNETNFSTSLDAYIRRNGEQDGVDLYNQRIEKVSLWANGSSWESDIEYTKFIQKRTEKIIESGTGGDNTSLKKLLTLYSYDDAIAKYNNYIINLKESNIICKEYYIKRNIENYDEIIRNIQLRRNSNTIGYASKSSLKVFIPLYKYIRKIYKIPKSEIFLGISGSREFRIKTKTKLFLYDFTILSKKIIIEYNGLYYHILPDASNLYIHYNKPICDIENKINRDIIKKEAAVHNGFNILYLWENINYKENINIAKKFIDNLMDIQ